jgi:hypothetical protein
VCGSDHGSDGEAGPLNFIAALHGNYSSFTKPLSPLEFHPEGGFEYAKYGRHDITLEMIPQSWLLEFTMAEGLQDLLVLGVALLILSPETGGHTRLLWIT